MRTSVNLSAVVLALIVMAVVSLSIMISLTQLDLVVHSVLYNFGLRFSYRWATPYWLNSGLIIVSSWFNIAASSMLVYYIFRAKRRSRRLEKEKVEKIMEEDKEQLKLSEYMHPQESEASVEEPMTQVDAHIQEQIVDLGLQIEEYDVRHPKDIVDSQC